MGKGRDRFPEVPVVEKKFQRSVNYIYKDVNQAMWSSVT